MKGASLLGEQVAPFTGIGPNTTNVFIYQIPTPVTNTFITIGQDPDLGLTFIAGVKMEAT